MYFRIAQNNPNIHIHKRAPIAEGAYKETYVDNNTIVIKNMDRSVETLSRSKSLLSPKSQTKKQIEEILTPISTSDEKSNGPKKEYVNMKVIVTGEDDEYETDENDQ